MFNPGVTNTDEVQRDMVRSLVATNTGLIFVDERWAPDLEPDNRSAIAGSLRTGRMVGSPLPGGVLIRSGSHLGGE
jgi:hypothetical protein